MTGAAPHPPFGHLLPKGGEGSDAGLLVHCGVLTTRCQGTKRCQAPEKRRDTFGGVSRDGL